MTETTSLQEIVQSAKKFYQEGDYAQAAGRFMEAGAAYAAAGDPLMAAEMANNRSVAFLRSGDAAAALEAVQGTDATFAQAGDLRRQGMALANQASALQALKRFPEAIENFKNSAAALEKAGEGDLRMDVMQLLSTLYLRRFKFYDAILALQSGFTGAQTLTPRQRLMKKILFFRL